MCELCSAEYTPTYGEQRTCGRECGAALRAKNFPPKVEASKVYFGTCTECGSIFASRNKLRTVCGDDCRKARSSRQTSACIKRRYRNDPSFRDKVIAQSHARRAEALGLGNQHITLTYLGERDGWRCGICHEPIAKPSDASIDHIIPLSRGGQHTLENVHISHRHCNYSKSNTGAGGEQLLLVG